jgi:hypothetical protein
MGFDENRIFRGLQHFVVELPETASIDCGGG